MSLLSDIAKVRVAIKGHDALALKELLAANNALSNIAFPRIYTGSALALAAALGDTSAVQTLLDHGAEVNQRFGPVARMWHPGSQNGRTAGSSQPQPV